jgi:BlaI family transcriptional regulator, penicillinase repressor
MPKKKNEQLTPLELEIMQVLWETGTASVQMVQEKLERELAYTTVQTMLNVLLKKGKAKRSLKDRAYYYRPAVSRRQIVSQTIGDIIDRMFGGSAEGLVMGMIETRHLTPEKLARLNQLIDESGEEKDGDN